MPVAISYPGVYIQEIPSGVHTITGVATSIAAFVDFFPQGPLNEATQIFSFADFQRKFGGLDTRSEASYAVQQFFLNGGSNAYVVRTASASLNKGATAAAIGLADKGTGGSAVLVASAKSPGQWGGNLRIDVDYGTTDPDNTFNMTVTQVSTSNGTTQVVATETFRNLVVDSSKSNDAVAVVNAASQLISLEAPQGAANRPAQTGTTSKALTQGDLSGLPSASAKLDITLGAKTLTTSALPAAAPASYAALASSLQGLIRGAQDSGTAAWPNATVSVVGSPSTKVYLVAKPGTGNPADFFVIADPASAPSGLAHALAFNNDDTRNLQQYVLGAGSAVRAQVLPSGTQQAGSDGTWDATNDASGMAGGLSGNESQKTGMYALLDVDLFNILCIPATVNLPDIEAAAVAANAIDLCSKRRAMYLVDAPQADGDRDTIDGVKHWLDGNASLRSRNAAVYFPRVDIADPANGFRLRAVSPSGTVAGLYARTDANRGVWKAPAGTEAGLSGVQQLEYKLTDPENGVLNPLAINCLRVFPIFGPVCWGARTLMGADQQADDYKYVPVRRLALYIEESLYRGTQWVVFEPNDEPLWAQIRLNVGAFMHDLFRKGAFQGKTPADAYFVKCDKDTTPQNDINLGIVNIIVGFAPLKPAEFVVISIQQIAGQIAS